MNPRESPLPGDATEEVSALIETLLETGQRLEDLTAGEMDTGADRAGRTFLVRGAQDQLSHSGAAKQVTILIVDDEIQSRKLLETLLQPEGYRTLSVANGEEALASIAQRAPDLILLDVLLPGMDGYQVASTLKADPATANIPIIMLTQLIDRNACLAGLNAGAEEFLTKPVSRTELWLRVRNLLRLKAFGDYLRNHSVILEQQVQARTADLQRFHTAMDATADAIYLVDRSSMRFVHVNDAACRMLSHTREELLARRPEEILSIPRAELQRAYDSLIASGVDPKPLELLRHRKDGPDVWVELRRRAQRSGDRWTIVTLVRDITERKKAEEEQRAMKQLLDNIVENIPTAVQLKSVQDGFRMLMWNKAAEAVYGLPREAAIGRTVHDLWPESDADRMYAADLELVAKGGMQDFPDRLAQTRNRGDIRVHMRKVALCDADGKASHLLVIADDITPQLADQARMRESEARFRSLTELSSDWYWEQDEEYRFARFSGGDRDAGWGKDRLSTLGQARWELPGVTPVSGSWAEHRALLEARKPFRNFEYQRSIGDGTLQYIAASGEPVFAAGGRFTGYRGVATDITERKRGEEELRRFASAMDATADAIYLVDRSSMRFVHVNDAACRMRSQTREELLALGPEGVLSTPRAELERTYDALIASGVDAEPLEMLRHRKDGSQVWVELRRHAQHSGDRWTIVTLVRDVTERKQAAQDLLESERRFSDMLENAELVSLMLDREARITYCNEHLLRLTGWRLEEVIGQNWYRLFMPPETGDMKDAFAALLANLPEARHRENEIVTRSGERRRIRWNNSVLRSGAGEVIGTASIGEDITEQTRGDEALLRFSAAMDAIADAVYLVDRSSMRYVYVNDAACRLANQMNETAGRTQNRTREELLAQEPWVVNASTRAELERTYDAVIAGGVAAKPLEFVRRRKDGLQVWDELRRHALLLGGRWMIVSLVRDITERKEAEDRIWRLNRMYAVLSNINALIVRARNRDELFKEACRIAVEHGNFGIAWIGSFDPATLDVTPIAWAGLEAKEYLGSIKASARADLPQGQGALGRAMRELRPVFSNDISIETGVGSVRRAEALRRGYRSLIVLPLIVEGAAVGNLSLFAEEINFFDDNEVKLLAELAGNISIALEHMARQEKFDRMTRVNAMLSGINGAIVRIRNRQELYEEACRIAVETGGLAFASLFVVDEAGMRLRPVASAGADPGFLETIGNRLSLRDDAPEGHGLGARSVREKRVLVVNDVEASSVIKFKKPLADRGIKSVAALPLFIADRPVGAFTLHSAEAGFFDDAEMRLLNEVAGNIAFALENIEREVKVQRLTRVYAVLSGINSAIVRIRERDELFREVCRIAVAEGGFIVARVLELDSGGNARIAATSESDSRSYQRLVDEYNSNPEHSASLLALALRSGQPLISNDVAADPRIPNRAALTKDGTYALALLPILVEKRVAGAFVLRAREAGMFNEDELRLLLELVSNLSFALELMDQRQKLDYLAYYDVLTGLANRSLFLERVAQYMRSAAGGGHRLALFLIDLERFKNINDSLGRPAGDALLQQVAQWLTHNVGDASLVARIGADHFAVVLPEVKLKGNVARLVEKSIEAFLEHRFGLNDAMFRIALKVGVALFPDDGAEADTLLRNAEVALKKAKWRGERYVFYKQKMTATVSGKLTLENQLRQALDKDEFVLHYQPKVNLVSGKLTGAEALIRWNDPRTGLVPPGRFIPVLEETGLIYDVGRWALRKAIEDYLRWRAAGLPAVRIAVNVSPLQLRNRGFIAEITQAIGIHAHAPAGLELEITESVIMQDIKDSIATLQAIRAMGVTIAIDDFGTGFSSLSYLSKLPVDTLKIDRSFVIDMTAGPDGLGLVSTVINLAHSLKHKVVAEGVETEEQSRLLRLLKCDEIQGYLFSRPVPEELFEARFLAPPSAG